MKPLKRASSSSPTFGFAALPWLILLMAASAVAQDAQGIYTLAPPAGWIDVISPQYELPPRSGRPEEGASILLFDRQIDVAEDGDAHYQHFAVTLASAADVDDYSQLNVTVDPTFQSLAIHWLRVIRNGEVIDQSESARITALSQETELRRRIYNGNYNVNVLLSDVRVGDIVDFAYTLYSTEQLFPGHFATRLDTAWGIPVIRQRIRVRSPLARGLRYRTSDGAPVPEPRAQGDRSELVMEWNDLTPIAVDPDIPLWYYPWPYLEISDLEGWPSASRLVGPLFAPRPGASRLVAGVVDEIRAAGGSQREQAQLALQYVQENIRYTSIAIGRGSHEPADPDVVLDRRFGDCKDTALLLATILNGLGIDAQPALVHSWRGRTLTEALPTPYAFDHVIVRAGIGGETYWLDATAPTHYSPLSAGDPANYGLALLVDGAPGLEAILRPAPDTRRRSVEMVFDLSSGLDAPGTLSMTTSYAGSLADAMRPVLTRSTPEQRQSDYTSYIASYYPGAASAAPVEVIDDKSANVLEIRESYRLERTFTRDESGVRTFYLHADELYSYADSTSSGSRRSPIGLDYPAHVHQKIVAHLPEQWAVQPGTVTVENPAFRYRSEVDYSGRTLDIRYEYQALADHVPFSELAQYEADRTRFYDDLGYVLTYNDGLLGGGRVAIAPLPFITLLVALGLGIWGAVRLYRYDPPPRPVEPGAPVGIRGWLLLPALGALVSPFVFGWLVANWAPFIHADMWYTLPSIVSESHRASAHIALLAIVGIGTLLSVASVLVAVLFFRKRTSAPTAYIALLWTGALFSLAIVFWAMSAGIDMEANFAESLGATLREVVAALIWTAYMQQSKRVRATFVRRRRQPAPMPAVSAAPAGL